jgi:hypothetical protein
MSPDVVLVDLAALVLVGLVAWYFRLFPRR